MLGTSAVGLLLAIAGFASSEPGVIGIGVLWTALFAAGGLHRHDWDALDRRAGIKRPDR
jgi:hypothetical protein